MQVGVKHPVSLAAFSVVVSRPSRAAGRYLVLRITRRLVPVDRGRIPGPPRPGRARGPSLGSPHPGRRPGLVTWPYAAGLVAGTAADSPATPGILSRPQVLRGAVQARREPGFVTRVLAGLSGRRPGRPGPAFPAAAPAGEAFTPARLLPQPGRDRGLLIIPPGHRPRGSRLPGARPEARPGARASGRPVLPALATGRAQPASHWV